MPNVPDDVPEYTGHRVMPSPQCQPLAPVSLRSQSRGGKQWSPLAHRKGDIPEFKGITELVLEAGIMVFPGDQTSPAHSAGGRAWGPSCMLGQLPYHSHLKICDGEVISRPLAPSPPHRTQESGSSPGSMWLGKPCRTDTGDRTQQKTNNQTASACFFLLY